MPISKVAVTVFLVLLLFITFLMVELFWAFVTPIVLALVLTSIFSPFYRWMLNFCRGHRHLSALLVLLIIIVCVSIPLTLFVAALTKQAFLFYKSSDTSIFFDNFLPNFSSQHPLIEQIHGLAASFGFEVSAEKIITSISELIRAFGHTLYESLSELPSNALSLVFNFLITMLLVYTFFVTGSDLKQYLMDISPLPVEEEEHLVKQFSEISKAVFVGNGVVSVSEGILGGFAFYWFGLGPALFWAVAIALSAFLPIVGAFIVVIPATIVLLIKGQTGYALAYLIFNALYLGILELAIKPRLIGGKSRLNTVLVLLSVLGGIKLFGVMGIFYGPLVVTMFLSLIGFYREHYREHLLKLDKG